MQHENRRSAARVAGHCPYKRKQKQERRRKASRLPIAADGASATAHRFRRSRYHYSCSLLEARSACLALNSKFAKSADDNAEDGANPHDASSG
jgi:hypothetical protein